MHSKMIESAVAWRGERKPGTKRITAFEHRPSVTPSTVSRCLTPRKHPRPGRPVPIGSPSRRRRKLAGRRRPEGCLD
jgi:hypothetical protein